MKFLFFYEKIKFRIEIETSFLSINSIFWLFFSIFSFFVNGEQQSKSQLISLGRKIRMKNYQITINYLKKCLKGRK